MVDGSDWPLPLVPCYWLGRPASVVKLFSARRLDRVLHRPLFSGR
jgi:hypothetical protein